MLSWRMRLWEQLNCKLEILCIFLLCVVYLSYFLDRCSKNCFCLQITCFLITLCLGFEHANDCVLFYRTADKESLTAELNKLQQSYRNVKGDLSSKVDQLAQSETNRRSAEEKVRQLTVHQNSVVRRAVQTRRKYLLAIKFNFPCISLALRLTWPLFLYSDTIWPLHSCIDMANYIWCQWQKKWIQDVFWILYSTHNFSWSIYLFN